MSVLQVKNLTKTYPAFTLDNVSFDLEEGKITGFIGRNGAGKSTTLNTCLNFVHGDEGEVLFFGRSMREEERSIKERVGFVSSAMTYYPSKRLGKITKVTRSFYENWDEEYYERIMKLFKLDERKTPKELSSGMKVKYSIALGLSHKADILILDELTSGLDPVSRAEIMEIFEKLRDEGKTILFSTHITSDIEKCADNILYIKEGKIMAHERLEGFLRKYEKEGYKDLDSIMVYLERGMAL